MFVKYWTFDYEYSEKIKPSLKQIIIEKYNKDPVKGGGKRTQSDLHKSGHKEVDNLMGWVQSLIPDVAGDYGGGKAPETEFGLGGIGGFSPWKFEIDACWGICYERGDSVMKHNHFPYPISFCYYVNTPADGTPFILEGERITPIQGKIIFFPGHQYHWVPKSKSGGRYAIVGNMRYVP